MWTIEVGTKLKRTVLHSMLGGNSQSGITKPKNSKDVLVFTSLSAGAKYGYDQHEGLRDDGSYAYTGEGQRGNQKMARGNQAIYNSAKDGGLIRLFQAEKTWVTYVGGFTLGNPPIRVKEARDAQGAMRTVLVFNLVSVNADVKLLPSYEEDVSNPSPSLSAWKAPNWDSYQKSQAAKSDFFQLVSRVEFELQAAFGAWLQDLGHDVKNMSIKVGSTSVRPDLFDATTKTIFEAKRASSRGYVREAIGQVLDYQNNAGFSGENLNCAILLPGKPNEDLVTLCNKLEIDVFVPIQPDDLGKGFESISGARQDKVQS